MRLDWKRKSARQYIGSLCSAIRNRNVDIKKGKGTKTPNVELKLSIFYTFRNSLEELNGRIGYQMQPVRKRWFWGSKNFV